MATIIRLNDACDSYWSIIAEQAALLARYATEAGHGKLIEAECTVIEAWCTDITRVNANQRRSYEPANDEELLGLFNKISALIEPKSFRASAPHWQPAMLDALVKLNVAASMRMQDKSRSADQRQPQPSVGQEWRGERRAA